MVTANPEHAAVDFPIARIDSRVFTALESIAGQRVISPPEMSWPVRRTSFCEPEWFELTDEFE